LARILNLYSLPDKIVALNEESEKVIYLVQFITKMVFGKRAITQVKVWRDKTETITKGLAEQIFFEFLLPQADCIVSDGQQTDYGRSFWELRIYDAFSRGLPVYLIDQNKRTKQRLQTPDEFLEMADQWWGDDPKFQAKKSPSVTPSYGLDNATWSLLNDPRLDVIGYAHPSGSPLGKQISSRSLYKPMV
jgi:hypothetical protein